MGRKKHIPKKDVLRGLPLERECETLMWGEDIPPDRLEEFARLGFMEDPILFFEIVTARARTAEESGDVSYFYQWGDFLKRRIEPLDRLSYLIAEMFQIARIFNRPPPTRTQILEHLRTRGLYIDRSNLNRCLDRLGRIPARGKSGHRAENQ